MRGHAWQRRRLYLDETMWQAEGGVTLPLSALLPLPDVTRLAPVVQAVSAHAVACEVSSRLLLTTRFAHLPNIHTREAWAFVKARHVLHVLNPWGHSLHDSIMADPWQDPLLGTSAPNAWQS